MNLNNSCVRSNGTAGVLCRLESKAYLNGCQISSNGLAGVEAREASHVEMDRCTLFGAKSKQQLLDDQGCSPQSLPAFLASHDSVGAGLFVHRGGQMTVLNTLIDGHRGYGAKLNREGSLRLTDCAVQRNRHGVMVDTQTALSVSEVVDMTAFVAQPDWPHPPTHAHACHSGDRKGAERWVCASLTAGFRKAGSRTVNALAAVSGCTVRANRRGPQLGWYGQGGVLVIDGVRRDTHFGDGDVDAAVTAAEAARVDRLGGLKDAALGDDAQSAIVGGTVMSERAWAAIVQNGEPPGGQEALNDLFQKVVECHGSAATGFGVVPDSQDDDVWEEDPLDAAAPVLDGGELCCLAPWLKVTVSIEGGFMQLIRGRSTHTTLGERDDVALLTEQLAAVDICAGQRSEATRDHFRLSDCSVRAVQSSYDGRTGVMVQERESYGKQCWLIGSRALGNWVATGTAAGGF